MKKKTMAFVMSLLMIVALVGVGFATWIITADTKEEATGNITVDTAVDTRIKVTATFTNVSGEVSGTNLDTVIFGHPATMSTPGAWLTNNGPEENLKLYLKLDIENIVQTVGEGESKETYGLTPAGMSLAIADTANKYDAAEGKEYVGALANVLPYKTLYLATTADGTNFISTTSADDQTQDDADFAILNGNATVIIPLTFTWGTKFGTNPYDYYNGKGIDDPATWVDVQPGTDEQYDEGEEITETYGDEAVRVLNELAALNKETFTITITGKADKLTK